MTLQAAVQNKAIQIGKNAVRMTTAAGSGHPSSALSLAHVVVALMYKQMRYDPQDPWNPHADRLILSEGHSVPIIYAAYADLGGVMGHGPDSAQVLTEAELMNLRELGSLLDGHPNPAEGFPFFDAATGSLGQGLSAAAGLALAARMDRVRRLIYVIIGDGESREGQVWEACDFIADYGLKNVCAIFNSNKQGQADYVSPQQSSETLVKKLRAYGWNPKRVDGHDADALLAALKSAGRGRKPVAIVAETEKGWGVEALKAHTNHGKPLPAEKLDAAMADLESRRIAVADSNVELVPPRPKRSKSKPRPPAQILPHPDFDALLGGDAKWAASRKLATRRAYGLALRELGRVNPKVVALDADVSNSTFAATFHKEFPDRFFECKIAEQNMVSAAVGLAAAGKIPFVSSFAKFLARAYDQVEMASITRANIKLVGSHSGVTLAADGPSQMGLLDVAYFRSFTTAATHPGGGPAAVLFHPADAVAAYKCTEIMANHVGLCYMRTHRPDVPLLYAPESEFAVGGCGILREGTDMALAAAGYMVHVALAAAAELAEKGIHAAVIDAYSLPIDERKFLDAAARSGNRVLSIEDNYGGGLGSALAEIAARDRSVQVRCLTVNRIPKSGKTPGELLEYCGVSRQDVVAAARRLASG